MGVSHPIAHAVNMGKVDGIFLGTLPPPFRNRITHPPPLRETFSLRSHLRNPHHYNQQHIHLYLLGCRASSQPDECIMRFAWVGVNTQLRNNT